MSSLIIYVNIYLDNENNLCVHSVLVHACFEFFLWLTS